MINLLIITIISIVIIKLIISIVANPFTELSPNANNISAIINVVTFESNIDENDSLLPLINAVLRLLPFLNSSFILSFVITHASTAIPIPRTNAPIPVRVSTPSIK